MQQRILIGRELVLWAPVEPSFMRLCHTVVVACRAPWLLLMSGVPTQPNSLPWYSAAHISHKSKSHRMQVSTSFNLADSGLEHVEHVNCVLSRLL